MKKILTLFILIFMLFSCSKQKNKELKFSEASGICYMQNSGNFYVVSDEGKILKISKNLKKLGVFEFKENYDFEGIVCDEKNNSLLVVNEKTGKIYKIKISTESFNPLSIIQKYEIDGYKLNEKGIEGFTKIGENKYVISTQTKNENLIILEFEGNKFKVIKKIDFPYKDLSGLEYFNKELYIISDKNDKIFVYDLEKEKILKEIKLEKGAWEGISFDEKGNIFLADDNGKIVKY